MLSYNIDYRRVLLLRYILQGLLRYIPQFSVLRCK
jgi:hypothetical protein